MKTIILISSLAIGLNSFAGSDGERGGNGGDAVVCPEGVYMLDSIESARRGHPLQIPGTTIQEKVDMLIQRVGLKDQALQKEIQKRAETLLQGILTYEATGEQPSNIDFVDGELVNVADEGATYIPPHCEIKQLIIQNLKPLPGDKKFLFQRVLWSKMKNDEKAAAISHEAFYGYLLENKVFNSPITRFVNGQVISGRMSNLSRVTLFKQLQEVGFPLKKWEVAGFSFDPRFMSEETDGGITIQAPHPSEKLYTIATHSGISIIHGVNQKLQAFSFVRINANDEWTHLKGHGEWSRQPESVITDDTFYNLKTKRVLQGSSFQHFKKWVTMRKAVRQNDLKDKSVIWLGRVEIEKTQFGYTLNAIRPDWDLSMPVLEALDIYKEWKFQPVQISLDASMNVMGGV